MNESLLLALPVVELLHDWDSAPMLFEATAIMAILCALLISLAGFRRTGIAPGPHVSLEAAPARGLRGANA